MLQQLPNTCVAPWAMHSLQFIVVEIAPNQLTGFLTLFGDEDRWHALSAAARPAPARPPMAGEGHVNITQELLQQFLYIKDSKNDRTIDERP